MTNANPYQFEHPYQPLRIPAGWTVSYNQFYELDATREHVEEVPSFLKEDMLQMRHEQRNRLLDLGFTPENDWEEGKFRLVLYEGDFGGTLLYEFDSRDKEKVADKINELLFRVSIQGL